MAVGKPQLLVVHGVGILMGAGVEAVAQDDVGGVGEMEWVPEEMATS